MKQLINEDLYSKIKNNVFMIHSVTNSNYDDQHNLQVTMRF